MPGTLLFVYCRFKEELGRSGASGGQLWWRRLAREQSQERAIVQRELSRRWLELLHQQEGSDLSRVRARQYCRGAGPVHQHRRPFPSGCLGLP